MPDEIQIAALPADSKTEVSSKDAVPSAREFPVYKAKPTEKAHPTAEITAQIFLAEIKVILNRLSEIRTDGFIHNYTPFQKIIYKFSPQLGLFHANLWQVKKIIIINKNYENDELDVNKNYYCIQLTDVGNNSQIYTITQQDAERIGLLFDLLKEAGVEFENYVDTVLVSVAGILGNDYWSMPYSSTRGAVYVQIHDSILEQLTATLDNESIKEVVLLEYGCGHGNLLVKAINICEQRNIKVKLAVGTDANAKSITEAKKHAPPNYPQLKFYQYAHSELLGKLKTEIKSAVDVETVAIALSSGATNSRVLSSINEAGQILLTLNKLGFQYVFLSGYTELLINSSAAKRHGFVVERWRDGIACSPVLVLKKQTQQQMVKYQKKFAADQLCSFYDHVLAMTPGFFSRLYLGIPNTCIFENEQQYLNFLGILECALKYFIPTQNIARYKQLLAEFNFQLNLPHKKSDKEIIFEYINHMQLLLQDGFYCAIIPLIHVYQTGIFRCVELEPGHNRPYYIFDWIGKNFSKAVDCYCLLYREGFISLTIFYSAINYLLFHYVYPNKMLIFDPKHDQVCKVIFEKIRQVVLDKNIEVIYKNKHKNFCPMRGESHLSIALKLFEKCRPEQILFGYNIFNNNYELRVIAVYRHSREYLAIVNAQLIYKDICSVVGSALNDAQCLMIVEYTENFFNIETVKVDLSLAQLVSQSSSLFNRLSGVVSHQASAATCEWLESTARCSI